MTVVTAFVALCGFVILAQGIGPSQKPPDPQATAEQKDFEAVYSKNHNGSIAGLEEMLDARYIRENPRFAAAPANGGRRASAFFPSPRVPDFGTA